MSDESGGDWPPKLQSTVFAANTQIKQSTGFTAYRLMFGRDCQSENICHKVKNK